MAQKRVPYYTLVTLIESLRRRAVPPGQADPESGSRCQGPVIAPSSLCSGAVQIP